jgi:hypothetical protein
VLTVDPRRTADRHQHSRKIANRRPLNDTRNHQRVDQAFDLKTPAFIKKIHRVEHGHERTQSTSAG